MVSEGTQRRLTAILSADVVGYSRLMAEDEDATVRRIKAYREEIRALVRGHRGRVATDAVEAAILGVEPRFDFLRSDPRFQDLLVRRIGIPES